MCDWRRNSQLPLFPGAGIRWGMGATWTPQARVRPERVDDELHVSPVWPAVFIRVPVLGRGGKETGEELPHWELQSYKNVETMFADPRW